MWRLRSQVFTDSLTMWRLWSPVFTGSLTMWRQWSQVFTESLTMWRCVQVILTRLRHRVLELTDRLHDAEVERRELRAELGRTSHDKQSLTETSRQVQHLQQQVIGLQDQVTVM